MFPPLIGNTGKKDIEDGSRVAALREGGTRTTIMPGVDRKSTLWDFINRRCPGTNRSPEADEGLCGAGYSLNRPISCRLTMCSVMKTSIAQSRTPNRNGMTLTTVCGRRFMPTRKQGLHEELVCPRR